MSTVPYPYQKESCLSWQPLVPSHWSVTPLRYVLSFSVGWTPPTGRDDLYAGLLPWVTIGDLDGREVSITAKTISHEAVQIAKIPVSPKGSLLFSFKLSVGQVAFCGSDVYTNEAIATFKASPRFCLEFAFYALPLFLLQGAPENIYGAKLLNQSLIRNARLICPSLPEQQAIAAFLDRETAKIDAFVAEQESLLALLAEKRQAVISRAVTQGLDPSVPTKDSGVEWMGQIPVHWAVRRVKSITTFTTSGPRGWSERVGDDGSLFIQSGDLNDRMEVAFDTNNRVQVEDDAESRRTCLRTGDVIVCITGAKTGNVAVCETVPEPAHVNQHLCIIRLSPKALPMFVGHALKEGFGRIHFYLSQYGLKQGLSLDDIKCTPLAIPSVEEQEAIAIFIKDQAQRFDILTLEAGHTIRLLKKRRAALISAAVTGKIDVRGLVPLAEPTREAA